MTAAGYMVNHEKKLVAWYVCDQRHRCSELLNYCIIGLYFATMDLVHGHDFTTYQMIHTPISDIIYIYVNIPRSMILVTSATAVLQPMIQEIRKVRDLKNRVCYDGARQLHQNAEI